MRWDTGDSRKAASIPSEGVGGRAAQRGAASRLGAEIKP